MTGKRRRRTDPHAFVPKFGLKKKCMICDYGKYHKAHRKALRGGFFRRIFL